MVFIYTHAAICFTGTPPFPLEARWAAISLVGHPLGANPARLLVSVLGRRFQRNVCLSPNTLPGTARRHDRHRGPEPYSNEYAYSSVQEADLTPGIKALVWQSRTCRTALRELLIGTQHATLIYLITLIF